MAKDGKPIPTGRIRRTAKVGGLVGGQAAKAYGTKAANVLRSEEGKQAASERRQAEAAEQIVEVLGTMKGAAMKVGQVASFIDTGALPPDVQERFQAKLAELRDSAPRVSFGDMRKVIEEDLDEPVDEAFAEFEQEPIAAASIGQVYRARLHDGREVAVKVQYPGVARAVRADLQNLGLILRAAKRFAPNLDAKALAAELRTRLGDELDYEHEAQSQRAFARAWRGHPFIVVPDVLTSMSREHVLVTEYVRGKGFTEVKELPQPERDRFGEIVFRFFYGSLYRLGHFSGDPHPGNFLLMDDGKVAFLDFGMTKRISAEHVKREIDAIRSGLEGDAAALHADLAKLGYFDPDDPELEPQRVLEYARAIAGWYREDRKFTLTRDYVARTMIDMGDPRSRYWDLIKRTTIPPEQMLGGRMQMLTLGVLGQLEATANWYRIQREWLYDEPGCTPLGVEETKWLERRGGRRVERVA